MFPHRDFKEFYLDLEADVIVDVTQYYLVAMRYLKHLARTLGKPPGDDRDRKERNKADARRV